MASADFNNVTLRNVAPANADGSFIRPGYVFAIGPDSKQYWTNTLYLDRIVVSTIYHIDIGSRQRSTSTANYGYLGASSVDLYHFNYYLLYKIIIAAS